MAPYQIREGVRTMNHLVRNSQLVWFAQLICAVGLIGGDDHLCAAQAVAPPEQVATPPNKSNPWRSTTAAVPNPFEMVVAAFTRAADDETAWLLFQSAVCDSSATSNTRAGVASALLSAATRPRLIYILRRACESAGPPILHPWSGDPLLLYSVTWDAMTRIISQGPEQITELEKDAILTGVIYFATHPLAGENISSLSRLMTWSGWTQDDIANVARQFASSRWNAPFSSGKIFGRADDGIEEELMSFIETQWKQNQMVATFAISTLVARQYLRVTPLIERIDTDIRKGAKALNPESDFSSTFKYSFLPRQLRRARMLESDASLLSFIASDFESQRYGHDDEDRLFAVRELLRRGVPASTVRAAANQFVSNMNPQLPPEAAWSRGPAQLQMLKSRLIQQGVLTDSDWPGVNVVPIPNLHR
jgi:hypothetical protein